MSSFLGLIFRTVGAWGAGKGANLTPAEADNNFWLIDQYLQALDADPPQAVSVSNITQTSGSASFTIWLTDGSSFPLTLPTATPLISTKTIADNDYSLLLADRGKYLRCTGEGTSLGCLVYIPSAGELSIPADSEYYFIQASPDEVAFEWPTDVTVNYRSGFRPATAAQFGSVMLKKVAADEWDLIGDLAAV